jgi:dihydrofolate synthase/folylpolyglutamate synthase
MSALADHPLHALPKFGDGTGLHRVRFLMEACGIDENDVSRRAIAITGSNGKGSTARITAELMRTAGDDVGLFTSPHLYRYNERFRINGEPVDDGGLIAAMDRVREAVEACRAAHDDAIGAFEAQFVVALVTLLARDCRWLVLEAGIGGRYDPVRLAHAPVTGLVSLDLEHTELLGHTLLDIALDKLDATPPGGIAVLGETCLPFADQLAAARPDIRLRCVEPAGWLDDGCTDGWQDFAIRDRDLALDRLRSRLVGRHQINNHAVAVALARERLEHATVDIAEPWRDAVARVTWPGRLERISDDPLVIVDVGHTPEGIKAALAGFRALTPARDALLVTGGSKNKHVRDMLGILAPRFERILCTAAYHNGLAAHDVEAMVRAVNPHASTESCATIEQAVASARNDATEHKAAIYVAGGLFLAAEFAESWRGGAPSALRFF